MVANATVNYVRLTNLLRRLGLPQNATEVDLRRAYFKHAKLLHPDAGGPRASQADFIALKKDFDEALQLISKPEVYHGNDTQRRSPADPQYHSAPPNQQPIVHVGIQPWIAYSLFGGLFGGAALVASVKSNRDVDITSSSAAKQDVGIVDDCAKPTSAKSENRAHCSLKRNGSQSESQYYKNRFSQLKSENRAHSRLKSRPHAKQRGLLQIPPPHQAAEDGLAEWLHYAGERSGGNIFQLLDNRGQTPLHYCARAGQRDACAVALKYHCDPRQRNNNGKTPLDLAREEGHAEIVEMFESGRNPLKDVQFRTKDVQFPESRGLA